MRLRADWIWTGVGPPIRYGHVSIVGDRIEAVGSSARASSDDAITLDFGAAVILPGLVNAHTHLELSCYRGLLRPQPFWSWLGELVRLRRAPGAAEREAAGVAAGIRELLSAGVTCVGDISRTGASAAALKQSSLRGVSFIELLEIAADPPRTIGELATAIDRHPPTERMNIGVSPHAPYTVGRNSIIAAVELAHRLRRPWCMHWLETAEERRWLDGDAEAIPAPMREFMTAGGITPPSGGVAPLMSAITNASSAWPGILAHGNYVADSEMSALGAGRHVVAYCPRTHAFFGHPPHPLKRLSEAGVRTALGTDSLASNPSLSVLDEARWVRARESGWRADDLLRMITVAPVDALGLGAELGGLAPGKYADLAVFRLPGPCDDPAAALLGPDGPTDAMAVFIGGKRVR